jgi:hypothetical protein
MIKYTKEDIIKGMEMPGRRCWQHEDKKVKASPGRPKGQVGSKYPFDKMNVGDCFVAGLYDYPMQQNVIGHATKWAGMWKPESRFITRKVNKHLYCWRIK